MSYVTSAVSTQELAARALDVSMFVGNNVLERYQALPQWRSGGSWAAGSDLTDGNGPTRWAFDRQANLPTFPTSVAAFTTVSLIFDLTPGTADRDAFDSVFIFGHNFYQLGYCRITLEIADTNDFSGGSFFTVATWDDPATALRLASLSNIRWSSLRYMRLRIRCYTAADHLTPAAITTVPYLCELWCGRARQQPHFPQSNGYDEQATKSEVVDFVADDGAIIRYVKAEGQRFIDATYNPATETSIGIDAVATFRGWWKDCNYGSKPSVFVESPTTALATSSMIMYPDPSMNMTLNGPYDRNFRIRLDETSPYLSSET
jgi:hypothetical protein